MENTLFISTPFGYNRHMPVNSEKKSEQVLMNLSPTEYEIVTQIAKSEDRPRGYVARELMNRGLMLYRTDGMLKDPANQTEYEVRNVPFDRTKKTTDETRQKRKKAG